MTEKVFQLSELLVTEKNEQKTDQISGRSFGIEYSGKIKLLDLIDSNIRVKFVIDDKVKAINDSFIKGLFSAVFKKYKSIKINQYVSIDANEKFKNLFEKNWQVLQAVNNV